MHIFNLHNAIQHNKTLFTVGGVSRTNDIPICNNPARGENGMIVQKANTKPSVVPY
jgi:hypothetical protein